MFWGLIMEPKRRYMQEVKQSFHISMAALDVFACSNEPSQVLLNYDNRNYLLCTLEKDKVTQCPLDLNFEAGDTIAFATNGSSNVHLTGYVVEEEGEIDEDGWQGESDEEIEDVKPEKQSKRKKKQTEQTNNQSPKKKTKTEELLDQEYDSNDDESFSLSKYLNDEAEEEEDSDEDVDEEAEDEEGDEEAEDEEMSDEESDDEEISSMSEDDEETEQTEIKINGKQKKQKNAQADLRASLGTKTKTPTKQEQQAHNKQQEKTPKKDKTPKQEKTPKENKTPKSENAAKSPNAQQAQSPQQKRVVEGGVVIQDLKVGDGQTVKPGKLVQVYYEGRLKQNNKVFDKCIQGQGFKFRLGKREVIRGWDIGVNGMKIGGKRRITCPPSMAYGEKGSPPQIPPNSTLIFEVELKGIK